MKNPNLVVISLGLMLGMRCGDTAGEISERDELFPTKPGCKLVRESCLYHAYCTDEFNVAYGEIFVRNYENQYNNCFVIYNNGDALMPINMSYRGTVPKELRNNREDSSDYYNDDRLRSSSIVVQSADFSNNGYFYTPYIEKLINLKTLNMSHNALTIAKLSNVANLMLQEIDYSFNNIETIDIQSEEYPYKELQVLNLSNNNLKDIPDAIFYQFTKLKKLDISHNFITNIIYIAFLGLKQISVLNLSDNHITSINLSLAKLYTLEELYLQKNNISVIQYTDINNSLLSLSTIDLSCNNLQLIEEGVFNNMSHLNFLNLKHNHLKSLETDTFANSNNLEYIDLSQNEITKLPIYVFKNKKISHFSLAENNVEGSLVKGMFEGLVYVVKLDLSFQRITSLDDAGFVGLDNIKELLLNNNQISMVAKHSFKLLTKLIRLDLSHNLIHNFTLNTDDLVNLEYLSISHNELTHIERIQFKFLNKLEFLDISGNKIMDIEPNSFSLLSHLKILFVTNNHLQGSLSQDTFNGLQAVPELDLSYSFLTAISNGSFNGMGHLHSINVSHCSIYDVSYNAFINTGKLDTLDLSYNKLTSLNINNTDMKMLTSLILQANMLQVLQENLFDKMIQLQKLDLSCNSLSTLAKDVFKALSNLEFLDISNNLNLTIGFEVLKPLHKLKILQISGTKVDITFQSQSNSLLEKLVMSNAGIKNLTNLYLINLVQLSHLVLSHNLISDIDKSIANMSNLHTLDLSFNKIKSLQPGSFAGCSNLSMLNISHNSIANINYGVFYGLSALNVLDLAYNLLENLEDEKFYQMYSLEKLVVDYNRISFVTIEQFLGTNLQILSIGGNPLPCKDLIKLKHSNNFYVFQITAMVHDDSSEHNYYGVSCVDSNSKIHNTDYKKDSNFENNEELKVLMDIRNILKDITMNTVTHHDWESLSRILTNAQSSSTQDELNNIVMTLRGLSNKTFEREEAKLKNDQSIHEIEKTNLLLERILKVIIAKNYVATTSPLDNTFNSTKYLKDLKEVENNFLLEKEKMVLELDDKISALIKKIESKTDINSNTPNFTEICTALILLILVSCVAFYIYRSQLISVGQRSLSTRQISLDMDNSNL